MTTFENKKRSIGGGRVRLSAVLAGLVLASSVLTACQDRANPVDVVPRPDTSTTPGAPPVTYTIQLVPGTLTLQVGQTAAEGVNVHASAGSVPLPLELIWTSDNLAIATVTNVGRVTAKAPGFTMVHANYKGTDAVLPVTVMPASAPAPINFVATGDMTSTRIFHTATLLRMARCSSPVEMTSPAPMCMIPQRERSRARATCRHLALGIRRHCSPTGGS